MAAVYHMPPEEAPFIYKMEKDPNGKKANEPGSKLDSGKVDLDLVLGGFPRALWGVGSIGSFGARKYTPNGWMSVPDGVSRYSSAMLRHYLAIKRGKAIDPDSGLLHVHHLAWNALALAELTERQDAPVTG